MSMSFEPAVLDAKMREVELDAPTRRHANDALQRMQRPQTEQNIRLAAALRVLTAESKGVSVEKVRLTQRWFDVGRKSLVVAGKKIMSYWAIPKELHPNLPQDPLLAPHMKDHRRLPPIPNFDPEKEYLLDKCVVRQQGWEEVECSYSAETRHSEVPNASAPALRDSEAFPASLHNEASQDVPRGCREDTGGQAGEQVEPAVAASTTPQQRVRELKEQGSDLSDDGEIDLYIVSCREAMEKNAIDSDEPNEPTLVKWFKIFLCKAWEKAKAEGGAQNLGEAAHLLPKFIATELLEHPQGFSSLPKLAPLFKEWVSLARATPGLVDALINIAEHDMNSADEVSLVFLKPATLKAIMSCTLYREFLDKKAGIQIATLAAACDKPDRERYEAVIRLRKIRPDDPMLVFGATLLGSAPEEEKICYVMAKETRLGFLRSWSPQDLNLRVAIFVQADTVWEQVQSGQFVLAADRVLLGGAKAVALVVNPVAKSLVQEFAKMTAFQEKHDLPAWLLRDIFAEVAAVKLGIMYEGPAQDFHEFPAEEMEAAIGKGVSKFCSARARKPEFPVHVAVLDMVEHVKKQAEDAAGKGEGGEAPSATAGARPEDAVETVDETQNVPTSSQPGAVDKVPAGPKSEPPEHCAPTPFAIGVGDEVEIVAKGAFVGKTGQVLRQSQTQCAVSIHGLPVSTTKNFATKNLRKIAPKGAGGATPPVKVVPAAGKDGHGTESAPSVGQPPAKKSKMNLEDLFGKNIKKVLD